MVIFVKIGQTVGVAFSGFSKFDVVVVPAERVAGLQPGEKLGFGYEEDNTGDCVAVSLVRTGWFRPLTQAATDQIDSVMMGEIHGSPAKPKSVHDEERLQFWKGVAHEEGFDSRAARMERRKCSKNHGRSCETRSIEVYAEELVDSSEPSRGSWH